MKERLSNEIAGWIGRYQHEVRTAELPEVATDRAARIRALTSLGTELRAAPYEECVEVDRVKVALAFWTDRHLWAAVVAIG